MAIGAATLLLRAGTESVGMRLALFAAWVVDASGVVLLLATLLESSAGSRVAAVRKLLVFVALLLVVSIALYLLELPVAALTVGGGPPLVTGALFGLFTLVLVMFGRNARWN